MKTINDLQNELDILFGNLVSDMTQTDMNLIMSFILTNFAMDFPEVYSRIYKLSDMTNVTSYQLYLSDIHENLLEVKLVIPLQKLNYPIQTEYYMGTYITMEEMAAIQLAASYINSMSTYYLPKKPMILTDNTGEYLVIVKDVVIMSLAERILDINNIPEHIYSILRYYTYSKFIDFVINNSFANMINMNEKIFDMMYNAVQSDVSTGDLEGVASVSLGPLSVSFTNKLNDYSNSLSSMGNNFANPNFLNEMNK